MSLNPRLAIICPACGGTGAVANVALRQAAELARHYRVILLSDSFPTQTIRGVEFCRLQPARFGWLRRFAHVPNELAFALAARRKVLELHLQSPVHVILCHGHPVARIACAPLRQRYGIPYALVTHGDIFDRPRGTYDPRLTWFYRRVTPGAYRSAELIIALSPHMREMALRSGADPSRIEIIPNGIDPAEIGIDGATPARQPPRPGERLELLYVGRLAIEKGVDVLIEACRLLTQRNIDYRLRIIGAGPMERYLRELARKYELDDRIAFLGRKARAEMGRFYRSAHVVCVPSRSDPLPTVVLEAMVCGVAVVGADIGGISAMVEGGITGLLFPSADPATLAGALQRLAADPELVWGMGEAGRGQVAEKFNWQMIGESLGVALKKVLVVTA